MRLTSLEAENIVSFSEIGIDLDPSRTVIVGPNSAGKTNLTRLIALMGTALVWVETEGPLGSAVQPGPAAQILNGYARARHLPAIGGRQAVRIGLELTKEWERTLVVAFVRAAVLSTVQEELGQGQQHQDALAEWVMATVTAATCEELFSGTLIAEHSGIPGWSWEMSFEFTHSATGERYRWILQSQRLHFAAIMTASTAMSPPPGLTTGRGALAHQLLPNWTPGTPLFTSLPQLPPFALAMLCPAPGAAVDVAAGASNQYLDPSVVPYRDFLRLAGLATQSTSSRRYALSAVLWPIWRNGVIPIGEQLRGVGPWGVAPSPAGPYSWEELANPPVTREPHRLPLRLFRLKNGSVEERRRYGCIQDAFRTLAPGREFHLRLEGMSDLTTGGTGAVAADARIEVMVTMSQAAGAQSLDSAGVEFPIQLHGAGTWEALVLAEALHEASGLVLVLDEPATTLHPSWQRSLATEIGESDGQLLLITHSPDLVRFRTADDLKRLIRLSLEAGASVARRFASPPKQELVNELLRELTMSAELRGCLFARGVVLVDASGQVKVSTGGQQK